jgi:hypothetical protein
MVPQLTLTVYYVGLVLFQLSVCPKQDGICFLYSISLLYSGVIGFVNGYIYFQMSSLFAIEIWWHFDDKARVSTTEIDDWLINTL